MLSFVWLHNRQWQIQVICLPILLKAVSQAFGNFSSVSEVILKDTDKNDQHVPIAKHKKSNLEHWETLGHLKSTTPNVIDHFASQSPLLFLVMDVVCTQKNTDFLFPLWCQLSKSDVLCWLFVNIYGSVAFAVLQLIDISSIFRLLNSWISYLSSRVIWWIGDNRHIPDQIFWSSISD